MWEEAKGADFIYPAGIIKGEQTNYSGPNSWNQKLKCMEKGQGIMVTGCSKENSD